ncbi:MAG: hypothetical protein K0B02_03150 [DPANN group archaeon]|nr:hypothetical protein [DPANN group archaeon]
MLRKFTDMHIQSNLSTGTSSVEEIIRFAEKLELNRIVLVDYIDKKTNLKTIKDEINKVETNIEVLIGASIHAKDKTSMNKQLNNVRDLVDIVLVHGGLIDINRAAVEDPRVDILAYPEHERTDSGFDHIMAKYAAENNVAIEINFRDFLYSYKRVRAKIVSNMRLNVKLAKKYGAPILLSSGSKNINDMRPARELSALGVILDLNLIESLDCVSTIPERIIEHNKKVRSKEFIMPGLKLKENNQNNIEGKDKDEN